MQWLVRRRRALPSAGEQLWIASFFCWTGGLFLSSFIYLAEGSSGARWAEYAVAALGMSMCPLLVTQTVCSLWGFVLLLRSAQKGRRPVPCPWTDRFGAAAAMILGLWIWHWPLMAWFRPS